MENAGKLDTLIRQLDEQKAAYLDTFQKAHDLVVENLIAGQLQGTALSPEPRLPGLSIARTSSGLEPDAGKHATAGASAEASSRSRTTGDDTLEADDDGLLYVQTLLEPQSFDEEEMRKHIRSHKWTSHGRKILDGVVGNAGRLSQVPFLPRRIGIVEDRSHHTHYQVFDVGRDGSPLHLDQFHVETESGRAMGLWHAIKDVNPPSRQHRAVGRITIVREPSPILFGAVHHTMNKVFDMDELFHNLVEAELSSASTHRAFEDDSRKQRSFFFNFEYFTLIGRDCQPMHWQLAAGQEDRKPGYIQITRCSSLVALALHGPPLRLIKNPARRRSKDHGYVYDPFSSWQVLNIQCCPDLKASLNVHDSTKHYVNGPEAFLNTLLAEFRDAQRRLSDITKKISRRVRPALEFMFDSSIRDNILFEDDDYTNVKSYFWAHQTLGIMTESIKAMIDAYFDTFTDDVWEGKHETLWPVLDETSSRSKFYKKNMAELKSAFEVEIANLRKLIDENNIRQREIIELREALFSGTSIQESRNAVLAARTTIQQGHNIKLLTLVSIFFLPLTFVTSVFGMENLPHFNDKHFWIFGVVTATVCVPFFILIGSLNTNRGMDFWRSRTKAAWASISSLSSWSSTRARKKQQRPGLIAAKSFESQTTATGLSIRRWSSTQKAVRSPEVEEPVSREEHQRRLEDLPSTTVMLSPGVRPTFPPESRSKLAEMWIDERKRRLRYSEDV